MISSTLNTKQLITASGILKNQSIQLKANGKIANISPCAAEAAAEDLIVPGFIDLQIYGAGGRLFSYEPTADALAAIEDDLLQKGTTGFLACIATNSPKVFQDCIQTAKAYRKEARNFLGLHLEGPYLNPKRLGAHTPEYVRKATLDEVKALIDEGDGVIKMITIAPECQDDNVIQFLLDQKIVLSLGHSDANFEQATKAYNMGIATTTHLFNAMSPIHHRQPGIPTAVFSHAKALASIIVDGHHVDFEVVKMAKQLLKQRLFLITDAVTPCAYGPYKHVKTEDKFVLPDGTLSGSALTMLKAVKNCIKHCAIDLPEAINMASIYPARLMGLANFSEGLAADTWTNMLVLDRDLNLKKVIFKGVQY